jgi:hypothetical protein
MRTLLRPGRRGFVVRLDGRGRTEFLVEGDDPRDHEVVFELDEALRRFADVECGKRASSRPRRAPMAMLAHVRLPRVGKSLRNAHA